MTPRALPYALLKNTPGLSKIHRRLRGPLVAILSVAVSSFAAKPPRNLADLTIEQLMNESITSVAKREQKFGDAAAAISVLTQDDLRRSGATSIAEALRLVPGMDVGGSSASDWAVSARGFNGVFSNKLLVLVDGRAVYNPLFSGVFWDLQQTMLEDVDRIEAIRGPGATVWGANAVNGVVNVVSRNARETQGGYIYGGGGDINLALGGARYGGQLTPKTFYRIFGSYQETADYPLASGRGAGDAWNSKHAGFRLDHFSDEATQFTWQADGTAAELDAGLSDSRNLNTLARWTRHLSDSSNFELQAYYDHTTRDRSYQGRIRSDIFDLTGQHSFAVGERHDVTWGLGSRFNKNRFGSTNPLNALRRERINLRLWSAFVQDEFKIAPDKLTLTSGLKLERNDYTGFELQPGLRTVFKPTERQTLWAAASRSIRTPNAIEGKDMASIAVDAPFVGPDGGLYLPSVVGNPKLQAEVLRAVEVGYRVQVGEHASFDLASFYNAYRGLIAANGISRLVPGNPMGIAEILLFNRLRGRLWGGEAVATLSPVDRWRISASYALLVAKVEENPLPNPTGSERSAPRNQVGLRSSFDFSDRLSADVHFRYVDTIQEVPSYITADCRIAFRASERLSVSLVGRNLLDPAHREQTGQPQVITTEIPRSVHARLHWSF